MTKRDIVRLVSTKTDLSQQLVKEIVQETFESIIEVLAQEGRIELRNFGVFKVRSRIGRSARNPRTGIEVWVPEHDTVTFKPGKLMVAKVQRERKKKIARKKVVKIKASDSQTASNSSLSAKPVKKAIKRK